MKLIKILTSLVLITLVSTVISTMLTGYAWGQTAEIVAISLLAIGAVKGIVAPGWQMPLNQLHDGIVISDTTYAGEAASTFIVKAITGNETVQGGHVHVRDGIKKQFTIPRWDADYEDFIQDRAATPTSKGTQTVDGQLIAPQDYMIYTEFNPRDFEAHWFSVMLNDTLIDRTLPATVESVVVQEVLKRHDRYLNKLLWNGDKTLSTIYKYFDGFIRKAKLDANTLVCGTPTTLTAGNISTEMAKGYALIPAALKYDPRMKFYCSYATFDLFMQYQIAQTYKGVDITSIGIPTYRGHEVVKIADLPDNFYLIAKGLPTPESNMWVGLNSTDDAKLELMKVQNNSELWFIKMLMKVDVQFGFTQEIVYYNGN